MEDDLCVLCSSSVFPARAIGFIFIFEVVFIFGVIFLSEVIFSFEVVFIFVVIFIFEVFLIFEVAFISEIAFILMLSSFLYCYWYCYSNNPSCKSESSNYWHGCLDNKLPGTDRRTGRPTDRTTYSVRQTLWLKSMDDNFIKYDSILGKPMDLNSKESLENPWTMVPRKTHDTLENQVYWEFQWHNPWEIQWGWKNWF